MGGGNNGSGEASDATDSSLAIALNADTTFGIIAGLAIAASHKLQQQEEEEEALSSNFLSLRRIKTAEDSTSRRRGLLSRGSTTNFSGVVGALGQGIDGNAALLSSSPSPNAQSVRSPLAASAKKYSVHEQRDVIRKLHERNQILKQELSIEYRDAKALLGQEKQKQVEYLQKTTATFLHKVEAARKNLVRVETLVAKKQHELDRLRQQLYAETTSVHHHNNSSNNSSNNNGGSDGANGNSSQTVGETAASVARRLRSLENRLELSLVKKNEMDSINKHLRAQIEKVRKDRIIFDGIYKKLERELSDCQQRYDASMDELQRATNAKEHVNNEILTIQLRADEEQRQYENEFRALKHEIEAFMREASERAPSRLLAPNYNITGTGSGNNNSATTSATAGTASAFLGGSELENGHGRPGDSSDDTLTRLTSLSSWKIAFDRVQSTTHENVVTKYDQAFEGIRQVAGMDDISQIAAEMLRKDEENFKRFKRVEELQREEVHLKAEAEQLTASIEAYKAQLGIATSTSQKQQYRALEARYQSAVDKNRAIDIEYDDMTTQLTRIKSSVHSIYSMLLHANYSKQVDDFGNGNPYLAVGSHSARDVTDTNLLEYLQAIETFTSSLMKKNHDAGMADGNNPTTNDVKSGGLQHGRLGEDDSSLAAMASSPVGHGPPTMSLDRSQKLRVQVPAFGGVNGVIVVPANALVPVGAPAIVGEEKAPSGPAGRAAPAPLQRRKTGRFELVSRKSFSQLQLPGMPPKTPPIGSDSTNVGVEDDEDERALTYEELRQHAAKNVVKRRADGGAYG
ncbi:TPA: hypothetical protein N0F65_009311 [Lagenidium giganteum]|uniref:ODAD1 central coiled coil region domain-containing protein n=1 Tax=Lagenidium giganteum TaxID=4803 RepID=A0AAV2YT44_9STRA|nr:TPA: hypothetical protein N0F65_009311 [Lagenidium giganteum]